MNPQRMPRQVPELDEAPSPSGRRHFYEQAMRASEHLQGPQGFVAMALLDVTAVPGASRATPEVLKRVTSRLAGVFNKRMRAMDLLVRTADTELAVLLSPANIGVAAAFSERLRQPIERAVSELGVADAVIVCMGLAANPRASRWHPDALIELADYRMLGARQQAETALQREWALAVDGESVPQEWSDSSIWPATSEITSHSSL